MRNFLTIIAVVFMSSIHVAQAQPVTVDPESIVPLPDKFDIELPAPDVPPEIARFHGAWIGTWGDDNRHVLVVERIRPDGRANVVSRTRTRLTTTCIANGFGARRRSPTACLPSMPLSLSHP